MNFMTGFFGVPGSSRGNFTVHVVNQQQRPICGWHPRKEQEFQWCAHGIHYDYVRNECQSCRARAEEILRLAALEVPGRKARPAARKPSMGAVQQRERERFRRAVLREQGRLWASLGLATTRLPRMRTEIAESFERLYEATKSPKKVRR